MEQVWRNWKTTIGGIACIVFAVVMFIFGKLSWEQALPVCLAGGTLLFAKDAATSDERKAEAKDYACLSDSVIDEGGGIKSASGKMISVYAGVIDNGSGMLRNPPSKP